jgi:hypothetical protein
LGRIKAADVNAPAEGAVKAVLEEEYKKKLHEHDELIAALNEAQKQNLACQVMKTRERIDRGSYEEYLRLGKPDLDLLARIYDKLVAKLPSQPKPIRGAKT